MWMGGTAVLAALIGFYGVEIAQSHYFPLNT
jgi:hypothetical protein